MQMLADLKAGRKGKDLRGKFPIHGKHADPPRVRSHACESCRWPAVEPSFYLTPRFNGFSHKALSPPSISTKGMEISKAHSRRYRVHGARVLDCAGAGVASKTLGRTEARSCCPIAVAAQEGGVT
ncbi:Replication 1a [Gossypium arboreum]|uniref:Replication 1a n=1 Tax=Gossypium arboreum TaxID=29729 RepID=A0A0B0MXX3_GOSAR|nr:Replication 1a [Gossypium arboreum]